MCCERNQNWQGMNWIRQTTRLAIYLRDGMACVYCGSTVEDGATLTLDHIKPVSKGGSNHPTNLVTCCHACNCARGSKSLPGFAGRAKAALVRQIAQRDLPRKEAGKLIARRGSVAKVLAA